MVNRMKQQTVGANSERSLSASNETRHREGYIQRVLPRVVSAFFSIAQNVAGAQETNENLLTLRWLQTNC